MSSFHPYPTFLSLVAAPLFVLSSTAGGQENDIEPAEILARMAAAYAKCSSYQDSGMVVTTFQEKNGPLKDEKPFKLFFKRPNCFRFEWVSRFSPLSRKRQNVVWCNGTSTFTYCEPDTYVKNKNLLTGIARAVDISDGAVYTVPRLLIEGMEGPSVADLTKLLLVKEERVDGAGCYVIKGEHQETGAHELWIGKEDYLLRKVKRLLRLEDLSATQEEIHKEIKVDKRIPERMFRFRPRTRAQPTEE